MGENVTCDDCISDHLIPKIGPTAASFSSMLAENFLFMSSVSASICPNGLDLKVKHQEAAAAAPISCILASLIAGQHQEHGMRS